MDERVSLHRHRCEATMWLTMFIAEVAISHVPTKACCIKTIAYRQQAVTNP
jgi:hypothetical protein